MIDYSNDAYWMARALKQAERGLFTTAPNPRVGCVIVKDGRLIGEGFHERAGEPHAEVHALAMAGAEAKGATAYVTLEPCSHHGRTPPCAEALVDAGVARVVAALEDPNPDVAGRGLARLEAAGIATRSGVLAEDAEALNPGFLKRMRTGLPWVTLKMASSLDGATALASGESQWITGPEARQDVQRGRARSCAILTGSGTVLADNPSMNVRLPGVTRQPDRLVLDTRLRTPTDARLFQAEGRVRLLHGPDIGDASELEAAGAELSELPLDATTGYLDVNALMRWLGQAGYNEVWVESGSTLAGTLLKAGVVDELLLYQAPKLLGANVRPLLDWAIPSLAQAVSLVPLDVRMIGPDVRWRLRPVTVSDST